MNETEKEAYIVGQRVVWLKLMQLCADELGYDAVRQSAKALLERAAAISALRKICAESGDNDWPDTLYLADIIEKHVLYRSD